MNNFNKLYEELLEAMDRRQFLKMLGKGAAVAATPKGVIAKTLTSVPASAKTDIGKALVNYLDIYTFNNDTYSPNNEYILGRYKHLYGVANTLFNAINQHKIPFPTRGLHGRTDLDSLTWELRSLSQPIAYLTGKMSKAEIPKFLSELGVVDFEDKDDILDALEIDLQNFPDSFDERFVNTVLKYSYENNLITPENQKILEDRHDIYKCDFVNDPASKARKDNYQKKLDKQLKDAKDANERREIAKNINYSRMDTAGGSEDVGYAQTYEKFFIENYADGKKPGRKGLAKRSGVNCKQSVSKLRKIAKNSSGERQRMAHWCANMKSGKKKKK